jgi:hypothetical protein
VSGDALSIEGAVLECGLSDFVIQLALRDIDAEALARALVDQEDEVRDIIFRNMTKRACLLIAGIESLAAKDNPVLMEEKLRSLVAGL